jgi:ABC-2 type transport system permease protein
VQRLSVLKKTLRDLRWQVLWYGAGLALLGAFDVFVYPSYKDQLASMQVPDAVKALIGTSDYTSPAGFLTAEFFSWVPVILVVFAVMGGTSALAGEEAAGTIELLAAQPLSRARLLWEKTGAFALAAIATVLVIWLGWLLSVPFVAIDISLWRLFLATLNLLPLTLFFFAFCLFLSTSLPDRRSATGLAAAVAVASYFINYLAVLVDLLKPFRYGSVFYYYDGSDVLSQGLDAAKIALLGLLAALFLLGALASFQRRDLGVHARLSLRFGFHRA